MIGEEHLLRLWINSISTFPEDLEDPDGCNSSCCYCQIVKSEFKNCANRKRINHDRKFRFVAYIQSEIIRTSNVLLALVWFLTVRISFLVLEKAHANAVFYLATHCRGRGSLCYRVASCRAAAFSHRATVLLLTALLANQHLYLKVAGNWRELMSHSKLTVASQSQEGLRVASQSEEGLTVTSQSEVVEPQATKNNRKSIQQGSE